MATLLEYTVQNSTYSFTPSATFDVYQQFTATNNWTVEEVYINAVSLIGAKFQTELRIYGDNGSDQPNLSDQKGGLYFINVTSSGWVGGTLASTATLISGTKYWIRMDNRGGVNDGANLGIDTNQGYSHPSLKWNGIGYDTLSHDFNFRLIGAFALPGKPTTPSPTDAASSITLDETPLSWVDGGNTDTYEVYFREQGDSWVQVGVAQAGVEWTIDFGTLAYGTTYEWRIDATNVYGTTTGDTWTFDTIDYDQIRVSYRLISGGNGYGPYDFDVDGNPQGTQGTDWEYTGENNMLTVKRLIAVANSKVWYESI